MTQPPARIRTAKTTCCYCGVGCGVTAQVADGRVVAVSGDPDHPANFGRLCVKGSALHETQNSPDRLLRPRVFGEDTDWDAALDFTAKRFQRIIEEHGPDAVAFYLSGQLLTEDYYVVNKLTKGFIGTANVDTNSRLCMASAVVAHKRAFGGDLVPGCYEDLEMADLVVIAGSNTAYTHPIVYQRIARAKQARPEMKVVVVDPRRTATCDIADTHLALKPGSDAYLFNGLLAYLAEHNKTDRSFLAEHCDGFEEALAAAKSQAPSLQAVAHHCELNLADLAELFQLFADKDRVVTLFSQGINQSSSGVDKGNAIINCHLASGKIGKPGAAPFSITGQPNAMGGREVGGLANQLAAHMSFQDPDDIERVQRFWNAPRMAQREGMKAVEMFQAVGTGTIKAIWIMGTNPVVSMPNADHVKRALAGCELVVVSECVANTDTARLAHVLLPATTWSEKNGTVTNSERCISLQKGFLDPPGEALNDWDIVARFARKLGFHQAFDYRHPVDIFREHAELSGFENYGRRGFDISGLAELSEQEYQTLQPVRWPVTTAAPRGTKRLFADGHFFTPNRRARLIPIIARPPRHAPVAGQVIMNTGRIRDQWHTMSRTGTAPRLLSHTEEPFVDVSPHDIARFGLTEGGLALLENQGVHYIGRVQPSPAQRPGEVFVPMHWNGKYAAMGRVDALVPNVVDPLSGQPEFKQCPAYLKPFLTAWNAVLLSTRDVAPDCDYWAKITVAAGYKYRLAGQRSIGWSVWLKQLFPSVEAWAQLTDSAGQIHRAVGYSGGEVCVLFSGILGGDRPPESRWLEQQLGKVVEVSARLALLAGAKDAPMEDSGSMICTCFQVGRNCIEKAVAAGCSSVEALGQTLKCGTNCGSCIPELKALIEAQADAPQSA